MVVSPDIQSIEYGLYYGECIGYCQESISITPERIIYTKRSNIPGSREPDKVLETKSSTDLWNQLSQVIDVDRVIALPDILGQPDAADQGGEYIKIDTNGISKRVEFERGLNVTELDLLLEIIRPLRSDLDAQMEK